MKKIVLISLVATFSLSTLSVVVGATYYFAVQVPQLTVANSNTITAKEQANLERERQENITVCLSEAHTKYRERWERNCEGKGGTADEETNCRLPSDLVKHLDEEYKSFRDECLKRYSLPKN